MQLSDKKNVTYQFQQVPMTFEYWYAKRQKILSLIHLLWSKKFQDCREHC